MSVLALSAPVYVVFTAVLLFAAGMIVHRTFDLVRHAKELAKDAKRASERVNEAAEAIETQVKAISERTADLGAAAKARPSGKRRRV